LVGVGDRLKGQQIAATIKDGKGRMPGYPSLSDDRVLALVQYLVSGESPELRGGEPHPDAMKYRFTGYNKFLDRKDIRCCASLGDAECDQPQHRRICWKIPLGEYPELAAKGLNHTGTENYGGPIVTAGGLLFIGATNFDRKFALLIRPREPCCGRQRFHFR